MRINICILGKFAFVTIRMFYFIFNYLFMLSRIISDKLINIFSLELFVFIFHFSLFISFGYIPLTFSNSIIFVYIVILIIAVVELGSTADPFSNSVSA